MEIVVIMIAVVLAGIGLLAFVLFTGDKGRGYGLPAETEVQPDPLAKMVFAAHVAAKDLSNSVMVDTPEKILDRLHHAQVTAELLCQEIQDRKEVGRGHL